MLFELRQYEIRPGKLEEWVRLFEEEIAPFQISKGMVVCGSFVGAEDPSVFVWLRRFVDEDERVRLYEAVYQSDTWKNDFAPRIIALINREQAAFEALVGAPFLANLTAAHDAYGKALQVTVAGAPVKTADVAGPLDVARKVLRKYALVVLAERLGVHPAHVDVVSGRPAGVVKRFGHREIGV